MASRTASGESVRRFSPPAAAKASSSRSSICLSRRGAIFCGPIQTPYEIAREFAFGIVRRFLRLRIRPQDVCANTLFQPFDHTADSFGTQPDRRHGRNLSGAHALPEVEPEDHAVALLIGTDEHTPQVLI